MSDESIIITEEENTRKVRYLVLRHRLKLEIDGLGFKGRPTSVYIREILSSTTRNKSKLLSEYEDWMVTQGFVFKRYTEPVKLTQLQEENHEIQNYIRRRGISS